jgi:hypothetical protein
LISLAISSASALRALASSSGISMVTCTAQKPTADLDARQSE